jgi:predicted metal-dependent peptidase
MFKGQQLTPQQRLDKAAIAIMGHDRYVAMAGIIMIGERSAVDNIPDWPAWLQNDQTAMTNGRDEWYANSFVETLSDKKLRGLMIHEAYHKMYRHCITWKNLHDENPELCAMACDYAINIRIEDDNQQDGFAELPDGGLVDAKYRDMNAAQIFNELKKEGQGGGGGGGQGQGQGSAGLDVHDMEGAQQLSEEEKRELERDIDEAIRQGALVAGKMGSGGLRDIEDLLEPQVDWRQALRDFVMNLCAGNDFSTWRMPSRRYIAGGMYMPRGVSENVGEVCIEIDMSGSTWYIVKYFMTEMKAILEAVKPDVVRVLYWDTSVCQEEKYTVDELDNLLRLTKPAGGGGTTPSCVPEYCNEFGIKPQVHIMLTDGYVGSDWGHSWNAPVLWVVCDNKSVHAPHGTTLHISSDEC